MAKGYAFIKKIAGKVGSGNATTTFTSGAVSEQLQCAQFFMTMQDRGSSLDEARAYANIGPTISPSVNWDEINRVLDTFIK